MKTEWDYTSLAKAYLDRPDYSAEGLEKLFELVGPVHRVCDVGAGVAHLTLELQKRGFEVDAVEPNDEMRKFGRQRTEGLQGVTWHEGVGEATGMQDDAYDMVTFGSSFNVTDRAKALEETCRILKSRGWFACMWNHRDLEDPLQKRVEEIIASSIDGYSYGKRREDQKEVIDHSNLFEAVSYMEGTVKHSVLKKDWVNAWRSHATLHRQSKELFNAIITQIDELVQGWDDSDSMVVPYKTCIWAAQKKD